MVALTLVAVIVGIIEFARLSWAREALRETAMAGARCMGVKDSSCAAAGVVSTSLTTTYIQTSAASWGLSLAANAVTVNANTSCAGIAGFSQVTITYTFQTLFPMLIAALSAGEPLTMAACFPNQV